MNVHANNFRDLAAAEFDTTHAAGACRRAGDRAPLRGFLHRRRRLPPLRDRGVQRDPAIHRGSGACATRPSIQGTARGGITSADGSYQEIGGRITRYPGRRNEKVPPTPHRDITLMRRWMDAMGVDIACMFPTPMLNLAACPRVEVEVALAQRLQPLALRQHPRRGAAHQVDALPAVQRSRGLLQDRAGIRRPQGRHRLHGDGDALPRRLRQRLHQDLRGAAGARPAARLPCRVQLGRLRACR